MEFNASEECAGDDAWACLTRRAEESLVHARVSGGGSGNAEQRLEGEEVEGLERTLLRYGFAFC